MRELRCTPVYKKGAFNSKGVARMQPCEGPELLGTPAVLLMMCGRGLVHMRSVRGGRTDILGLR